MDARGNALKAESGMGGDGNAGIAWSDGMFGKGGRRVWVVEEGTRLERSSVEYECANVIL